MFGCVLCAFFSVSTWSQARQPADLIKG
jgi:hypothetical protein